MSDGDQQEMQPAGGEPQADDVAARELFRKVGIERIFAFLSHTGPAPNPIAEKMTPEHISEIISSRRAETSRDYEDKKHARLSLVWFLVFVVTVGCILTVALILSGHDNFAVQVLDKALFTASGFGAGFGVAEWRRRNKE